MSGAGGKQLSIYRLTDRQDGKWDASGASETDDKITLALTDTH